MITVPYSYRNGKFSATTKSLPTPLCSANQSFWMKGGASIYSGTSISNISLASSPCFNCVSVWKDQSPISGNDDATILQSIRATNLSYYPQFNADYPAGELSTNYTSFVSFDRNTFSPNKPNFLTIPYNSNFSRLKSFTFSTIFRCRRINPNIMNSPNEPDGAEVVLFENANTSAARGDGWGIDVDGQGLRIWYKDISVYSNNFGGNSILLPITDWTKWMRLTMRVSGTTLQANIYNNCDFYLSGNTWLNGSSNGSGNGIEYDTSEDQQLFVASQIGYDYPTNSPQQSTLNGSWDILDFTFYDNWLTDSCIQNIWDYYDTQYGDLGCSGNPTKYSTIGTVGSSPTSKNLPIDISQKYFWSGSIYRQNEINSGGSISELSYYVTNSPSNTIVSDVKLYIGHTSLSAFTSSVPENLSAFTTNWTLVYDGAITFKSGWSKISLAKVFSYNNTDNILIKFQTTNGIGYGSTSVPNFKYSATSSNTVVYQLSPGSYPLTNGTSTANRPIIKIGFL